MLTALSFLLLLTTLGRCQQPQVDVVKTDVLPYDKSTTRVTVAVKNVATAELHNIWVKVSGSGSTIARRKVPYLKPNDTRNIQIDAPTSEGPWRVDVESVDWNWQQ